MALRPHVSMLRRLLELARTERCQMEGGPFRIRPATYSDPERLALERERVFSRLPLVVGHASMLPEPGDALTFDVMGLPLLLTRARDGRIRGFYNVCRHRGARLLDGPEVRRCAGVVCPYHSWTYELDGGLRHVPHVEGFPGLDPATRGLVRIPLVELHGLLLARLGGPPERDAAGYLGEIADDMEGLGLAGMHCFARRVSRRRTNWKLVIDAFLESYHVRRLHRASVGKFFLDNVALTERCGLHTRSAVARAAILECADLPEESWDPRRHASVSYTIFPNTVLVLHPDYTSVLGVFPEGPEESTFSHVMLTPHAPRDERERAHWQRSLELIEGAVFQGEDLWIAERIQSTLRCGANETLLYGALEFAIRGFHEDLDAHLGTSSILEGPTDA